MSFRVGIGFDSHRFIADRPLILAGISIPWHLGLKGHSDADALWHAITDALLGAASLGDIGSHFPDIDPTYKNRESAYFLQKTKILLDEKKYKIIHIDSVVILEKPKLADYILPMRQNTAKILELEEHQVSIKAKTAEGMGYIGRGEGIAVHAAATLTC